jgi:hypothetical protein
MTGLLLLLVCDDGHRSSRGGALVSLSSWALVIVSGDDEPGKTVSRLRE